MWQYVRQGLLLNIHTCVYFSDLDYYFALYIDLICWVLYIRPHGCGTQFLSQWLLYYWNQIQNSILY